MNFDEKMKEINKWLTERGLDDFYAEDCLVNRMKRIDANTLEIEAFTNIYLKNDDCYSAQIKFIVKKRELTK